MERIEQVIFQAVGTHLIANPCSHTDLVEEENIRQPLN